MNKTAVAASILITILLLVSCMKKETAVLAPDMDGIEGVHWYLTEVAGAPVSPAADDKQPHMLLDPAQKQATGFAGCNHFFGSYELDGSSLTFGPIGATRMACPDLETGLETSVFNALESAHKWKIEGGDLLLLKAHGVLARFSREQYDSGTMRFKRNSSDAAREFKTKTGKTIIVSETHPVGRSLSTIEIRTRGFENEYHEIYLDWNPISDICLADLDGNGFDEIYIITKSVGSGSYGSVLGFASNKDKSLSMIHFPEIRKGDENFEGYMGHDTFKIEGQKLVRMFPVYNEGDTNGNPTGGRRKLVYGLVPGEAMWQLKVEKSERLNAFQ